jgi:hypothetical protein
MIIKYTLPPLACLEAGGLHYYDMILPTASGQYMLEGLTQLCGCSML